MWNEFETGLRQTILDFPARAYLIIHRTAEPRIFVQFAGIIQHRAPAQIEVQLGGNDTLHGEYPALRELGFSPIPDPSLPGMWHRPLPWPPRSQTIREVAQACVIRLRDIAGITDPSELTYRSWQDPEPYDTPSIPGVTRRPLHGKTPYPFPELGIPTRPSDH